MEKIFFDDSTYIWKTKLNYIKDKLLFLKEAYVVIESHPNTKTDGYGYKEEWKQNIDFIGKINIEEQLIDYVIALPEFEGGITFTNFVVL